MENKQKYVAIKKKVILVDINCKMLIELDRLEKLSEKYTQELKLVSKRIRNDIWNTTNGYALFLLLHSINNSYEAYISKSYDIDLNQIINYISVLAKMSYKLGICPSLNWNYYECLIDDIVTINANSIINDQWKNITESVEEFKSFLTVFDEIFKNTIITNRQMFFHTLCDTDVLCRVVNDKYPVNKQRFIPWEKASTINRWNPPGKTYLYLSFTEHDKAYDSCLQESEYICLEEYRAQHGNMYYFCNFYPNNSVNVLDLSYNDTSLFTIRNQLSEYGENIEKRIIEDLKSTPELLCLNLNNHSDRRKLQQEINTRIDNVYDRKIIEINIAKQYLKLICTCIYKKVDESDDEGKKRAYQSFWALAEYLENNKIQGIIYPCTRTNVIKGKNLVLFNKYDAEPIESSIREFFY